MVFFTQIFPKIFAVLKIPQKNTTIFAVTKISKKFLHFLRKYLLKYFRLTFFMRRTTLLVLQLSRVHYCSFKHVNTEQTNKLLRSISSSTTYMSPKLYMRTLTLFFANLNILANKKKN